MKVFHVVQSLGPTWICYIEKPEIVQSELYETWLELAEFKDLCVQFERAVVNAREFGTTEAFPLHLTVHP